MPLVYGVLLSIRRAHDDASRPQMTSLNESANFSGYSTDGSQGDSFGQELSSNGSNAVTGGHRRSVSMEDKTLPRTRSLERTDHFPNNPGDPDFPTLPPRLPTSLATPILSHSRTAFLFFWQPTGTGPPEYATHSSISAQRYLCCPPDTPRCRHKLEPVPWGALDLEHVEPRTWHSTRSSALSRSRQLSCRAWRTSVNAPSLAPLGHTLTTTSRSQLLCPLRRHRRSPRQTCR